MFQIFNDELAKKKMRQKEKMFAELTKAKTEGNTKMEIVKEFTHK